jgi:hypothetical protein
VHHLQQTDNKTLPHLRQLTFATFHGNDLATFKHRWVRLLRKQTLITIYRLPTKENQLPFSVFRLQKTNGSLMLPFSIVQQTNRSCLFS